MKILLIALLLIVTRCGLSPIESGFDDLESVQTYRIGYTVNDFTFAPNEYVIGSVSIGTTSGWDKVDAEIDVEKGTISVDDPSWKSVYQIVLWRKK